MTNICRIQVHPSAERLTNIDCKTSQGNDEEQRRFSRSKRFVEGFSCQSNFDRGEGANVCSENHSESNEAIELHRVRPMLEMKYEDEVQKRPGVRRFDLDDLWVGEIDEDVFKARNRGKHPTTKQQLLVSDKLPLMGKDISGSSPSVGNQTTTLVANDFQLLEKSEAPKNSKSGCFCLNIWHGIVRFLVGREKPLTTSSRQSRLFRRLRNSSSKVQVDESS